jgi:hypothetical protein
VTTVSQAEVGERTGLSNTHLELGDVLRITGRPGEARASYEGALAIIERVMKAQPGFVLWMKRDPDLDPLRARPDFQLVMIDLAFPAGPFAS